ncbi:unnamed protein product, partial [Closterium sp. Yama58-4]
TSFLFQILIPLFSVPASFPHPSPIPPLISPPSLPHPSPVLSPDPPAAPPQILPRALLPAHQDAL